VTLDGKGGLALSLLGKDFPTDAEQLLFFDALGRANCSMAHVETSPIHRSQYGNSCRKHALRLAMSCPVMFRNSLSPCLRLFAFFGVQKRLTLWERIIQEAFAA